MVVSRPAAGFDHAQVDTALVKLRTGNRGGIVSINKGFPVGFQTA